MSVDKVLAVLDKVTGSSPQWEAKCPAHEDRNPSLSVAIGEGGKVIVKCHRGCSVNDILAATGLGWNDIMGESREVPYGEVGWEMRGVGTLTDIYRYYDADGREVMQVCRFSTSTGKSFRQRQRNGDRWEWKAPPRPPLYRLPAVLEAIADGQPIFVVEGEKDVNALVAAGCAATCNPMGAGKWKQWHTDVLAKAARVIIIADCDDPGRKHAREIADALLLRAAEVCICEPVVGKDISDHIAAGHAIEDLWITFDSAGPTRVEDAWGIIEYLALEDQEENWIVPGLLTRGDRFGLTGFEGQGKTTMLRQLAVTAALGYPTFIPPTINSPLVPATVLFIDLENGGQLGRVEFREVTQQAGMPANDKLFIIDRPQGLDVLDDQDRRWLLERVTALHPDLLIVTPWYKLSPELEQHGEAVYTRRVIQVLDEARAIEDCALALEMHTPVGDNEEKRSLRPTGPGVILRWFEFGFGMRPRGTNVATWETWRGSRAHRKWPRATTSEGPLPWNAMSWRQER